MVVALAALFVALGGSSYAALALKQNSVLSKHIKNGQVKGVDLGKASVDSSKVVNGKLLAEDFATGQLPAGERGAQGSQGAQGAQGLKGEPGADGADRGTIAAQPRCSGCPVSSGPTNTPVPIPLTDSQWTQDTNEGNILFVEVELTPPVGTCTGTGGPFPGFSGAAVTVMLDGSVIASPAGAAGQPTQTSQGFSGYIFPPDTDEPHTVTAEVADNCAGSENATVEDVKVVVLSSFG
jgi:hypothetical protein